MIAEAELVSEAARPKPRRNRTSGLMFVLKTSPWRPGDLNATENAHRCSENRLRVGFGSMKCEPFVRNASWNEYRRAEMPPRKHSAAPKLRPFVRNASQVSIGNAKVATVRQICDSGKSRSNDHKEHIDQSMQIGTEPCSAA